MVRKKVSKEQVIKKAREGGFSTLSEADASVYVVSEPAPPTARMVVCWKCKDGFLVAGRMFCNLTNEVVEDFLKPPNGCPIRTRWEEDDKHEQGT